jgi:hypothetical protein
LFPIAPFALLGSATGFSDDAVEFARVTCAHEASVPVYFGGEDVLLRLF